LFFNFFNKKDGFDLKNSIGSNVAEVHFAILFWCSSVLRFIGLNTERFVSTQNKFRGIFVLDESK
jgi:hypothetical protein